MVTPGALIYGCAYITKSALLTGTCLVVVLLFILLFMVLIFQPGGGFAIVSVLVIEVAISLVLMPCAYFISKRRS